MRKVKMEEYLENWYALHVKTGDEERVKKRLEYRFNEDVAVVCPKRRLKIRKLGKWSVKIKPLFPGYVLVNGNFNVEEYYKTKRVPGLYRVLKSGLKPVKVPLGEIDFIIKAITGEDTIGISTGYVENERVIITNGPLTSLEGNIVSVNKRKGRVRVKLSFLGEERHVDLGIDIIEKA
jgi:transcriptional antiterminator NusG